MYLINIYTYISYRVHVRKMFNKTFHSNSNRTSLRALSLSPLRSVFAVFIFDLSKRLLVSFKLKSHMISFHCYRVWRTTTAATIAVAINSKSSSSNKTRPIERKTAKHGERKINRKRKLIILRVHFDIFLYALRFVGTYFIYSIFSQSGSNFLMWILSHLYFSFPNDGNTNNSNSSNQRCHSERNYKIC